MKHRITVLLFVLVSLLAATQTCFADLPGEGYAWPTFREMARTFILMKGEDIKDNNVADVYGQITDCKLYKKDFNNDFLWGKIRKKIVARVLKKKEYYRVRYQVVIPFRLKRYNFKKNYFPVRSASAAFQNVGYLSLYTPGQDNSGCGGGNAPIFSAYFMLQLASPLTIDGLHVSDKNVAKLMARMQEAGNVKRKVYARIRVVVTGAEKGVNMSADNYEQAMLKGYVTSVDFFMDPALTEPIGHPVPHF